MWMLSGQGLSRSACSSRCSLSAKRIFSPSIVRNCGSIDVFNAMLTATPSEEGWLAGRPERAVVSRGVFGVDL